MKKFAFLTIICIVSVMGSNAQVQFGLKGGLNFASITDNTGGKTLISFNAGVLIKAPLTQSLSLQPEIVYSAQGIKADNGKLAMNYINVPFLLTYTLPEGLFFQTGPQLGFLVSAKARDDSGNSADIKDLFKSTDFAWVFGTGYLIPKAGVGFNARYNLGISSVGKEGGSSKNSVFQVGIFILFHAAGK